MSSPSRSSQDAATIQAMDSPDHIATPGMWSYACRCLRCRWEQWWNEGDNYVVGMPDDPHPEGEFLDWFNERERWSGAVHPNEH